jgi:predicted Rossmann fold flavoprotein
LLLAECGRLGIEIAADFRVADVVPLGDQGGFELRSAAGKTVPAARVVLATGGLSLPKTGSDGAGLRIASAMGHVVAPTYPALVPLLSPDVVWKELAGIALVARLRALRAGKVIEEREREILFTHRGFSGPVVLDMSRHVTAPGTENVELRVKWGGAQAPRWEGVLRQGGAKTVLSAVREHLPRRLGDRLVALAGVGTEVRLAELSRAARLRLIAVLEEFRLPVAGSEGYATAEVTGGGVPLSEVHLDTLESRRVPGLHFAGEILDVTGRIGGYNFLWAFVSGRRAGEGAVKSLSRSE